MEHKLFKKDGNWNCEVCCQKWKGKPRAACPGLPVRESFSPNQRLSLKTKYELADENLKPIGKPAACFRCNRRWDLLYWSFETELVDPNLPKIYSWENRPENSCTSYKLYKYNRKPEKPLGCIRHHESWIFLYDLEQCPIDDPSLPPYREYGSSPELKTRSQLKKQNLIPGDAQPRGFFRSWDEKYKDWDTILLWHPNDCQWQPSDNFIAKVTLRSRYLLSDGWIKRLGEPDKYAPNPHHEAYTPMRLYSRQRVEAFLAENVEEYCDWLENRERYVAIFEANREAIEQGRDRYLEVRKKRSLQQRNCLKCASGCATSQGFLCAIYPLGLEDWQIPCADFRSRNPKENEIC